MSELVKREESRDVADLSVANRECLKSGVECLMVSWFAWKNLDQNGAN